MFNNDPYTQPDGCPMGGCISQTLANVFLFHHESAWLKNCPSEFKPVFYKSYADDIFALFHEQLHNSLFYNYPNNRHNQIKFTAACKNNNSISFLDILIKKINTGFGASTYNKPTATGLGSKFESVVSSI